MIETFQIVIGSALIVLGVFGLFAISQEIRSNND